MGAVASCAPAPEEAPMEDATPSSEQCLGGIEVKPTCPKATIRQPSTSPVREVRGAGPGPQRAVQGRASMVIPLTSPVREAGEAGPHPQRVAQGGASIVKVKEDPNSPSVEEGGEPKA